MLQKLHSSVDCPGFPPGSLFIRAPGKGSYRTFFMATKVGIKNVIPGFWSFILGGAQMETARPSQAGRDYLP